MKGFQLSPDQERALSAAQAVVVARKSGTIAGGPGTGKTTMLRELISTLEAQGCSVRVVAPTGTAIHKLGRQGIKADTLASLDDQGAVDLVIVEDASILDTLPPESQETINARLANAGRSVLYVKDAMTPLPVAATPAIDFNDVLANVQLTTVFRQRPAYSA